MVRKLVVAAVSAASCLLPVAPSAAFAQEHRFAGFDAPRGMTATVNLRVPFGPSERRRPSYGVTFGYGQEYAPGIDGRTAARPVNVADLRFSDGGLTQARVASFDLANLDDDRRLNLVGKKSTLILGIIVGAAIVICIAADCFDGDDAEPAD